MRNIRKGCEPQSLTKHSMVSHSNFDNYRDKNTLRQALVSEQRGLCCYCMGRIHPKSNSMKIEHWRSRAQFPGEQLKYQNLLGSCPGGQGQPASKQHCDTKKGDRNLKWNPSNRAHNVEALVRYETDGSIRANDVDFDHQIDRVLNLNLAALKNNRKNVLNAILDWWRHEKARIGGSVPRGRFIRQRNQQVAGNRPLQPYCQVAVWWLDQRLAKMSP